MGYLIYSRIFVRRFCFVLAIKFMAFGSLLVNTKNVTAQTLGGTIINDPPQQPFSNPFTQTGTHYFALEDLSTGQVTQRGEAGSIGVAFDNLIVSSDTQYRAWILQAESLRVGFLDFTSPGNGRTIRLGEIQIGDTLSPDSDGDGLHDAGEFVMGTNASQTDSDEDGILDGAEVRQGSNPLDGLPARTGLIASADTQGTSVDVAARDEVVAVADSSSGVALFNIFNGMNPTLIAQVDTPGTALAVALEGNVLAVADGTSGIALIDISDPPAATIYEQVRTGGSTQAINIQAGAVFAGTDSGALVQVDASSGDTLSSLTLPGAIQDLRFAGDFLYVLTQQKLHVIEVNGLVMVEKGSVDTTGSLPNFRMRLFVGDDTAYAMHRKGYNTIDVSDPNNPQVITVTNAPQFGWKQIVLNGSGLGVAAVSPNLAFDGPHNVSLYDVTDPTVTDAFIAEFATPGVARAVSIFNGIAYVADHGAGLQVVNYLAYDSLGTPPLIGLTTNLNFTAVEEGKVMRITAEVEDDVQVRNVEFYVEGVRVATDGNFPFEHKFVTPLISTLPQFTLQARASDTGGNATWTDELTVNLLPDSTPPMNLGTAPIDGIKLGGARSVAVSFDEAINPGSVNSSTFVLTNLGPDEALGGADDIQVAGVYELRNQGRQIVMLLAETLENGMYNVNVNTGVTDLAGNAIASPIGFDFEISDLANVAEKGTPTDPFLQSANVGQLVTLEGSDFIQGGSVDVPIRGSTGTSSVRSVALDSVAPDGSFATLTIPEDAETGTIALPDGSEQFLQIVPTVTSITGGKGRFTEIYGTGFIEGSVTVIFGDESVVDGGPFTSDGVNVRDWNSKNDRLDVTVPLGGTLPYVVQTEGGQSGRVTDVETVIATSDTGTALDGAEASANVGQVVTLTGSGFVAEETMVTLEAINGGGTPYITTFAPDTVSPDGEMLTFTVPPEARTGVASVIDGGSGKILQIIPRVLSIIGGKGRFTEIYGTGFTEGFATAQFGPEQIVDGGPFTNDGINVRDWDTLNDRLDVTVPLEGTLPYEIITEGGSSGRIVDVTSLVSSSDTGTPKLPEESSANVGQSVTIGGEGFVAGVTKVTIEAMTGSGTPYITTIDPDSVSGDGTSLSFTIPGEARTGIATIMSGGSGLLLQVVPRVVSITGGKGRFTDIRGTGFTEGFTTAKFGSEEVVDGGPFTNDGIDIRDWDTLNDRLDVTLPLGATLPYEVVTEGGSSGRLTDVLVIDSSSESGTPLVPADASANVGQVVTIEGEGFIEGTTMVTLEAMTGGGTPYITAISPDTVAPDGSSLTFTVPPEARTGVATIMSGGNGLALQIVPEIVSITGGRGRFTDIRGTGFIEGFTTVTFGPAQVVDGGPFTNDGIDVRDWDGPNDRLDVTVPANGTLPYRIVTEGGSSGLSTDLTVVSSIAIVGTPADGLEASGNVGQVVTLDGDGFVESETKIALEAMTGGGTPYIIAVDPISIAPDGKSLTFEIPTAARTGPISLLNGGASELLQVVPTLTSVSSVTPGLFSDSRGSGFIEGFITIRFGTVDSVDGGPFTSDGVDARDWDSQNDRADTTVPTGGSSPVVIITEGGTSNSVSP